MSVRKLAGLLVSGLLLALALTLAAVELGVATLTR